MPTAKFDQNAYRSRWLNIHGGYERSAYRYFKTALDTQTDAIIKEIEQNGVLGLNYFLKYLLPKAPMQAAYLKVYRLIGVKHARFTFNFIKEVARETQSKARVFGSDFFDRQMIEYYLQYGALRVTEVDDTTIEYIQLLLAQSRRQNMTASQQAEYIVNEIGDPKFNRMRALRIGRTESTTAANYGAHLAGQESDYVTVKVWIAAEDFRTRKGHAEQNGKEVDPEARFTVRLYKGAKGKEVYIGEDYMLFPGDTIARAGNVVNCRCTVAFLPLMDEDGLPVFKNAA
jgi:hypothetical protein